MKSNSPNIFENFPEAAELRAPVEQASSCTLLVFALEQQSYAMPIDQVEQVIPMLKLTSVPQVAHMIEGVVNIHGQIVPVVSTRRHLGYPEVPPDLYTPIILTRVGQRTMGLIVDEVTDVISVAPDQMNAPEKIMPEGMKSAAVLAGVVYQGGQAITVIDPRYLLNASEVRAASLASASREE